MSLDERFGLAQLPSGDGVREGEGLIFPRSLIQLKIGNDAVFEDAKALEFLRTIQNGCRLTGYLSASTTLLWIVDRDGVLRMAVEEAFLSSSPEITVPLLPHNPAKASEGWRKLGHPSLLEGTTEGRIGGELFYRPPPDGYWELNNRSGRYGRHCGRSEAQLAAVAECLESAGVDVDIDFL